MSSSRLFTSGPTAAITTDIFAGFMVSNNNLDLVVLKYKYIKFIIIT